MSYRLKTINNSIVLPNDTDIHHDPTVKPLTIGDNNGFFLGKTVREKGNISSTMVHLMQMHIRISGQP